MTRLKNKWLIAIGLVVLTSCEDPKKNEWKTELLSETLKNEFSELAEIEPLLAFTMANTIHTKLPECRFYEMSKEDSAFDTFKLIYQPYEELCDLQKSIVAKNAELAERIVNGEAQSNKYFYEFYIRKIDLTDSGEGGNQLGLTYSNYNDTAVGAFLDEQECIETSKKFLRPGIQVRGCSAEILLSNLRKK